MKSLADLPDFFYCKNVLMYDVRKRNIRRRFKRF